MTDLPTRMREAAKTLEEASKRDGDRPTCGFWNAHHLRHYADQWERKDAEEADREVLINKLLDDKRFAVDFAVKYSGPKINVYSNTIRDILADYDIKKK